MYEEFNTCLSSNVQNDPRKDYYDPNLEFEYQIQLGSKLYPEYPAKSNGEAYDQSARTWEALHLSFHSIITSGQHYRNLKITVGLDFKHVLKDGFTGLNTKLGDVLTI